MEREGGRKGILSRYAEVLARLQLAPALLLLVLVLVQVLVLLVPETCV